MLGIKNSINKNIKSYGYALKGIYMLFEENNFRIQLLAATIAISLGFRLGITADHWLIIIACIGVVLMAEAGNTALEKLCDHLHPQQHEVIGKVKDLSAGAVLIVAFAAAIIGTMVFWQYF
ncbi:hypothetical protein GCM10011506_14200 [Marivirga lumbricoides]|uniref:Diacylglycerol kinase n=1 Tax=Marivirga lumbricoides TaxID=1046115 RepID=A0ABQ1LUD0_9BACT|nr:hypothetical protein GCM10011506_14200 [Marivirga lumbricoides]